MVGTVASRAMTLRRLAASTLGSNAASTSALAGYRLTAESAAIYALNGRTSDVAEAREGRSGALRAWTTINPGGIHEGTSFNPRTRGMRTSAYISDKDETDAGDTAGDDDAGSSIDDSDSGIEIDDVPATDSRVDDPLPEHLTKPRWLRKKLNRKEKGSYEGMLTEIDSYPDFDPPGGNLYNVADFSHPTIDTDAGAMTQWQADYMRHQKELWAANTGNDVSAIGDEEFIEMYDAEFATSEEDRAKQILTWEVTNVLEAGGDGKHPMNRKVILRVKLDALKGETGLSDEALEYIAEICGARFDAKRRQIKITCSRSVNREHNRQWCLKVLYDLIMEGNREFPSDSYRFTPEGPVEPGTAGAQ